VFNEKAKEWTREQGDLPVYQTPKYLAARAKAIEIIESGKYGVTEADFWILMNLTSKKDKMAYSGLIISHNGCLKINDRLDSKFDPACVALDKDGWGGSLVYTYCNPEQGIYENGEVSKSNCKNDYPYAMAFKRCFDRVVLKLSKLAYDGIYSDSESEEFMEKIDDAAEKKQEQNADQKAKTYGTDREYEAARQKLLSEIASVQSVKNIDGPHLEASCRKNYKKGLHQLANEQLAEVLEKLRAA
jgi:hypothetical protein